MKKCTRCKRNRTEKKFAICRSRKDGLQPYCRDCASEYRKERAKVNKPREPLTDGAKPCCVCDKEKPYTEFPKHRGRRDGRGTICKSCQNAYSAEHYADNSKKRKAQVTAARRKRVAAGSVKERDYQRSYRSAQRGSVLYEMRRRASDARKAQKRRGHECSLTAEDLVALWEAQDGRCALSGVPMVLGTKARVQPMSASVDRIDSSKGYAPDNVRLVTWIVNRALADWSDAPFFEMCRGVVSRLEASDAQAARGHRHGRRRSG